MISHADDVGGGKLGPKRKRRSVQKMTLRELVIERLNECANSDQWQQQDNAQHFVNYVCAKLLEGCAWVMIWKSDTCESYFYRPPKE